MKFIKENPDLDIREKVVEKDIKINIENKDFQFIDKYSKGEGYLSPELFIIISGGEKREQDYFKILIKNQLFSNIKIEFICRDPATGEGGLDPNKMFSVACSLKEKYDKSKNDDIVDKIYLIVDVDDFMNILVPLKIPCRDNGFKLIISNCCFEVWLHHGESADFSKFNIPEDNQKISSAFKTYLNTIKPGGVNPVKAIFDMPKAAESSRYNYREDSNGIPCLFSTQMHFLAEDLSYYIASNLEALRNVNNCRPK
jgi:hypothetical protein